MEFYLEWFAKVAVTFPVQFLVVSTTVVGYVTPTAPLTGGLRAHGASFGSHRAL
jgi:hypothetical protein